MCVHVHPYTQNSLGLIEWGGGESSRRRAEKGIRFPLLFFYSSKEEHNKKKQVSNCFNEKQLMRNETLIICVLKALHQQVLPRAGLPLQGVDGGREGAEGCMGFSCNNCNLGDKELRRQ